MQYRKEIDGLRAVAIIPVILFHTGLQSFSGGFVGVDVFFVISGYLITSIILTEKYNGSFSLLNFYERRARRILPPLFIVMLICLPFAWFYMLPSDMKEFTASLACVSFYISNILFWQSSGYFAAAAELNPLLHTWSLSVEEQYYLLFPLFISLIWKLGKRWIFSFLLALTILSLALTQWGCIHKPSATFFLLPTRGWEILIGSLLAFYLFSDNRHRFTSAINQIASFTGLLLLIYSFCVFDRDIPFPSVLTLIPTLGTALIIMFGTQQTVIGKLLSNKIPVGIGLISYSTYLWHQPLYAFARHINFSNSKLLFIGLAILALIFAFLSWKYIETPFRNKQRFSRTQIFCLAIICSTFYTSIGIIGYYTNGFSYRYPANDRELAELEFSQAGKYVEKRFNTLQAKPFDSQDQRRKLLIIGDSFAQDLVNALYEANLIKNIQISTRYISHNCGNLFLESNLFEKNLDKNNLHQCHAKYLFNDKKLRETMLLADEIWFASSWKPWQAKFLPISVENVKKISNKPVKIFGTKDFGNFNIKQLLTLNNKARLDLKNKIRNDALEINIFLKKHLSATDYIDVHMLLCGKDPANCHLFLSNGKLISYDGGHLTQAGAKYYGEQLAGIL